MDNSFLKQFLILTETLNFTQAAEKAFVAQPTLSRHISALEKELGVKLFIRTKKSVVLTEEGKALAEHARIILDEYEKIYMMNSAYKKAAKKDLKIRYSSYPFVLELCTETENLLKKSDPDIHVQIIYGPICENLPALLDRSVDGVFVLDCGLEEYPKLKKEVIAPSDAYVIVNRKNPLAKKKEISLKEISDTAIILPERDTYPELFDFRMKQLLQCGMDPENILYVSSTKEAMAMVSQNRGVAILNEDGSTYTIHTISAIPVSEKEFPVNLVFVWEERSSRSILRFVECLKKATAKRR